MLLPAFAGLTLLPSSASGEVQQSMLRVGQGWALVHETRLFPLRTGVQPVLLDDIPETADLSTLVFRHRRAPIDLLSWQRVPSPDALRHASLYPIGNRVIWMPHGAERPPAERARRAVRCTIRTQFSGSEPLELSYLLGGLSWRAHYQLAVRGDLSDERDPVSIDLMGRVAISNGTDRAFAKTALSLLTALDQRPADPRHRAGWLAIPPFTTLAHAWPVLQDAGKAAPFYPLSVRADIAPRAVTEIEFATTRRAPARRIYRANPERLSQSRSMAMPMDRLVVIDNQPSAGLGFALPEGEAEIYLGGIGMRLWEQGWLPHTPAGQRMEVNLGPAEMVTVRFEHVRTERLATGNLEETYEIQLRNELESPVFTEISAIPDAVTAWAVTRSSSPFQREGRRLVWTPTLPARGELTLRYQLRVQPDFDPPPEGDSPAPDSASGRSAFNRFQAETGETPSAGRELAKHLRAPGAAMESILQIDARP